MSEPFRPFIVLANLLAVFCLAVALACCDGGGSGTNIASVDGAEISLQQFNLKAAFMGLGADAKTLSKELREAVLQDMIHQRLLINQAGKLGVRLSDSELKKEETMLRRGMDEDAFQKNMLARGLDYDQWRQELADDLLVRKTIDLVLTPKVQISQDDIVAYYKQHPDEFSRPEQILALHLVMPDKRMADELVARMERGQDMVEAARQMGVSLGNDGQPDWLSRGHMPDKLENAIFSLRPGRPAGPFQSDYGYHVVWVIKKRPAVVFSLTDAAGNIQEKLAREKKDALAEKWIDQLRNESEVWVDPYFLMSGMRSSAK